jgi:ZIP family zinc transporter
MGSDLELIGLGVLGSLLAGAATGLGALPGGVLRRPSERLLDIALGIAAGIMLAATAFSLLVPALELGHTVQVTLALLVGAVFVEVVGHAVPVPWLHRQHAGHPPAFVAGGALDTAAAPVRSVHLLVVAMTLHNLPEGLSVGVTYGSGDVAGGTALAIGSQNIPEGLAVSLALLRIGYPRRAMVQLALATGLVEPVAGLVGASLVVFVAPLLPLGLAFAAGAMLYVVFAEVIPESQRHGYGKEAAFGALAGFALMMFLDTVWT